MTTKLAEISVEAAEVADLLRNLDVNKALAPDRIPARVLNELAPSLCYLFNKSLNLGVVPLQWKRTEENNRPLRANARKCPDQLRSRD